MNKHHFETFPLDLNGISRIEVRGYGGEVSVIAGNKPSACNTFSDGEIECSIQRNGKNLLISARLPLLFPNETKIRIELHIPSRRELRISGESVPVKIKGAYEFVDVSCSEGDIILEDVSGKFNIASAKGDIVLRNVTGGVNASTCDGDILASNLFGEHNLQTSTGTLSLEGGEGKFKLSSKYSLSAKDILFRKESGSYFICEGPIRVAGLSADQGCVLHVRAPKGKIKNELRGFHLLQSGKSLIATSLGLRPSRILLRSKEEIFLDSENSSGSFLSV